MHIESAFRSERALFLDCLIYSRGFSCLFHSYFPLNVGPFYNGFSDSPCLKLSSLSSFPIKQLLPLNVQLVLVVTPFSWALLTLLTLFLALHSQSGVRSFLLHPSSLYFCLYYLHLNAALMPPSQSIVVASNEFPRINTLFASAAGLVSGTLLLGGPGWFLTPLYRSLQCIAEKSLRSSLSHLLSLT